MLIYFIDLGMFLALFTPLNIAFAKRVGIGKAQSQISILSSVCILVILCLKHTVLLYFPSDEIQNYIEAANGLCIASATACMLQEMIAYTKHPEHWHVDIFYNTHTISAVYCIFYAHIVTNMNASIYMGIFFEVIFIILSMLHLCEVERYHIFQLWAHLLLRIFSIFGICIYAVLFEFTWKYLITITFCISVIQSLVESADLIYTLKI
jgi:hypothetical protein